MNRYLRKLVTLLFIASIFSLALWIKVAVKVSSSVRNFTSFEITLLNNASINYQMDSRNSTDYTTLMNIKKFKYNILNTPCNDEVDILVLILVHSAPLYFEKRMTIRKTWGQKMNGTILLFMLGAVVDANLQKKLFKENRMYKDLVQGNFYDAYVHLTYKHAMVFKYTLYHCPNAKYLLKTDDDVFINTYKLIEFLKNELPENTTNLLLCEVTGPVYATRSYRLLWRVSFEQYKKRFYPKYCPGWSIIYSKDLVFRLHKELQKTKYFWIDDVLITGVIFKKLNMTHLKHNSLALTQHEQDEILAGRMNISATNFLFGYCEMYDSSIRKLWKILTDVRNIEQKEVYVTHFPV